MKMRLKELRKNKNITQKQAAEFVDLEPASISRIENGIQNTTTDKLQKFAELYGVSVPELFHYDGDNELIRIAFSTPPDQARYAVSLLRTFQQHSAVE